MKHQYESEILYHLMERDGFNIPSSVPPYESEIKAYLINQVKLAYPKLTDYEAEWLLYNYTKHLPSDFPISSVSDVTTATFENVVPYAYQSAILKGQTLVNSRGNTVSSDGWSTTDGVEYIVKGTNSFLNFECTLLPNTKYLIFFEFDGRGVCVQYGTRPANGGWDSAYSTTTDGICKKAITTGSESKWLSFIVPNSFTVTDYVKISRIMIIPYQDGMENWDIPYFEGMQSVKMPVLTTVGKNLFGGELEIGSLSSTGAPSNDNNRRRSKDFFPFNGDITYITTNVEQLYFYDENKNFIYRSANKTGVSPTNTCFIKVRTTGSTEVQIEKGTIATSYEPYKSNILTVNDDVTLRGIGNVQDTLDCLTGEVTERIAEVVLDGSENDWYTYGGGSDTHTRFVLKRGNKIKPISNVNDNLFSCDKFKNVANINGENSQEMCLIEYYDDFFVSIIIENTKLNSVTVDGFKSWLQSNNVKIQYAVENESIKTVDLSTVNEKGESTYFMPLEGTMNVSCSSETIQPTFDMSVPVEATTQNLASFIDLEMEE